MPKTNVGETKLTYLEFEAKLKKAQKAFERRRRDEVKEIVANAVRSFDSKVPAYIMANYVSVIEMTTFHRNEDKEKLSGTPLMTEFEFEERLSHLEKSIDKYIVMHTLTFKTEAGKLFENYIENRVSLDVFSKTLIHLESLHPMMYVINPNFKDELYKILNGYFWGRDSITYDFIERYEEHIMLCCKTITAEETFRNIANSSEFMLMTDEEKQRIYEISLGYSKKAKVIYD